jgi:hypothetical protein
MHGMQTIQDQSQRDRRRIGDDVHGPGRDAVARRLDHRSAQPGAWTLLAGIGQVDQRSLDIELDGGALCYGQGNFLVAGFIAAGDIAPVI